MSQTKGRCTPTSAQRCHNEGKLHRWCLKEASKGSLPHKMHDLVFSAGSRHLESSQVPGQKEHPSVSPSPLLSLTHPCWLFPVPPAEEGAGVTWLCPWMNLRWIGSGHQDADQRWLCQGFPEVAKRLQKVCQNQRWLCGKKWENTSSQNYKYFQIICVLQSVFELTSYASSLN